MLGRKNPNATDARCGHFVKKFESGGKKNIIKTATRYGQRVKSHRHNLVKFCQEFGLLYLSLLYACNEVQSQKSTFTCNEVYI